MTHKEIKKWLDRYEIENYIIKPDGVVDVKGSVDLGQFIGTTLPIQFGKVTGSFYCSFTNMTSLTGGPQSVGGNFQCGGSKITSLIGAPESIGGYFHCCSTKMTSLSGINKIIKEINGRFICSSGVTHLLGLLLIKGINGGFNIDAGGPIDQIFNKYIGTGDILSAQDELIDAGFIDQARL